MRERGGEGNEGRERGEERTKKERDGKGRETDREKGGETKTDEVREMNKCKQIKGRKWKGRVKERKRKRK